MSIAVFYTKILLMWSNQTIKWWMSKIIHHTSDESDNVYTPICQSILGKFTINNDKDADLYILKIRKYVHIYVFIL